MAYPYQTIRDWLEDEERNGHVIRFKQPIKCGDYDNLVDIDFRRYNAAPDPRNEMQGVHPATDVRALCRYLHTLPGNPIGIIENPVCNRPDIPVVVNLWPSIDGIWPDMGLPDKAAFVEKMAEFKTKRIPPTVVDKSEALCKQVIIPEDEVDLRTSIPRIWVEFNKLCFTACNGTIIAYDPETGTHGLTKTRLAVFDWDNGDPNQPFSEEKQKRYGFATMARPGRPGQGNTGRYYFDNYRDQGKSWPAAFVYGVPTDIHVLAAIKNIRWPEDGNEYDIIGGFRGEPLKVVPAETIPGMMVPADAEWVLEGEFVSEDYRTPVASEDLGLGFIWGEALWPLFKVNCITHREKPIWTATTFSSVGSMDHMGVHSGLSGGCMMADVLYMLRSKGLKVKEVTAKGIWTCIIQLEVDGADKPHPDYGMEVGRMIGAKYTVVVGPDIDINNLEEVLWAIGTRAPRNEWIDMPSQLPGKPPIPRYGVFNELTTDMGFTVIDATISAPGRFDTFPPRTEPPVWEQEAIERMRKMLSAE